jgi:hypothetical protein
LCLLFSGTAFVPRHPVRIFEKFARRLRSLVRGRRLESCAAPRRWARACLLGRRPGERPLVCVVKAAAGDEKSNAAVLLRQIHSSPPSPQQHQCGAKKRKFRVSHAEKPSPDSESARRELSKSGVAFHVGPQKCDVTSESGGGTTVGAPTWTRVRPRRNQCTTEAVSRTPYRLC